MNIVVAALLLVTSAHASAEDIEVSERGAHGYSLKIVLPKAMSLGDAKDRLWPQAQTLCADRVAKLGKYRFEASAPLIGAAIPGDQSERMVLIQELECIDYAVVDAQESPSFVPAPATPPTTEDEATVRDISLLYLAAVDEGRFDDAFAMMSPTFRPMMAGANWRETRSVFNSGVDSEPARQIVRLTWYDDPTGAPMPGRYVAADYRGDDEGGAFYCGYLMWLLQADGSYRLVRSEEGMLSREEARRIPPASLAAVRAQLQCRD